MIYRAVLQDVLPVAAISRFIGDIYPAIDGGAAYEAGVLQSSGLLHYVRNDVVFIVIAKEQSDCGNLRQGRPPFVAMRHFPRFIGDIYPAIKVGVAIWSCVLQSGLLYYVRNDGLCIVLCC